MGRLHHVGKVYEDEFERYYELRGIKKEGASLVFWNEEGDTGPDKELKRRFLVMFPNEVLVVMDPCA